MRATIVSVGTELVTGQTVDTNSAWISSKLTELGVNVATHITVGDDFASLSTVLSESILRGGLIVVTGGLGPTLDDLTRAALAQALDESLEEEAEALRRIQEFFTRRERIMPESNRLQALRPRSCTLIANGLGTAPGIRFQSASALLFAVPGVPAEMKAMFDAAIAPELGSASGVRGYARVLRTYGLSESDVGERLADLMQRDRNPSVGTTASRAVISVRIVAVGRDIRHAQELAEADAAEIRRHLGHAVFGEGGDTLQDAVGGLLRVKQLTVATAESCTGGLLAKYLTDIPGSSEYFQQGYVTYSNTAKSKLLGVPAALIEKHGAVSEAVARELASQCRTRAGVDFALATTGIAGPTGGHPPEKPIGLIFIGLAGPHGVAAKKILLGDTLTRDEIRDRASKAALNWLRLQLQT